MRMVLEQLQVVSGLVFCACHTKQPLRVKKVKMQEK